jgi:hypothetical protein
MSGSAGGRWERIGRASWWSSAGRFRRGLIRRAMRRIRVVRLRTRFAEGASCWGGTDRDFARTTVSRDKNVGAPTLKVMLEGFTWRVGGEKVSPLRGLCFLP